MQRAVSQLLKNKRREKGLSQAELAEKLGYSSSQLISNIERGLCGLPIGAAKKICKILSIPKTHMLSCIRVDWEDDLIRRWESET